MLGPELKHGPEELLGENRETLQELFVGWAQELYEIKESMLPQAGL